MRYCEKCGIELDTTSAVFGVVECDCCGYKNFLYEADGSVRSLKCDECIDEEEA